LLRILCDTYCGIFASFWPVRTERVVDDDGNNNNNNDDDDDDDARRRQYCGVDNNDSDVVDRCNW
jgi:hypothetical protein